MKLNKIFLIISLVLILSSINFNITSNTILEKSNLSFTPLLYLGLIFFVLSILTSSKSLETILIPTGMPKAIRERAKKAVEILKKEKDSYVLISGEIERDERRRPKADDSTYQIYKELRKNNFYPKQMIIEGKSRDSLENFLYSLKRLNKKGISKIKIVTNPLHYARFKLFEKKARKQNMLPENFEMSPVYTKNTENIFYGILAYIKDYIRMNSTKNLADATGKSYAKTGLGLKEYLEKRALNKKII